MTLKTVDIGFTLGFTYEPTGERVTIYAPRRRDYELFLEIAADLIEIEKSPKKQCDPDTGLEPIELSHFLSDKYKDSQ